MQQDLNEVIFGSESLEQCSIDGSVAPKSIHIAVCDDDCYKPMAYAAWPMAVSIYAKLLCSNICAGYSLHAFVLGSLTRRQHKTYCNPPWHMLLLMHDGACNPPFMIIWNALAF